MLLGLFTCFNSCYSYTAHNNTYPISMYCCLCVPYVCRHYECVYGMVNRLWPQWYNNHQEGMHMLGSFRGSHGLVGSGTLSKETHIQSHNRSRTLRIHYCTSPALALGTLTVTRTVLHARHATPHGRRLVFSPSYSCCMAMRALWSAIGIIMSYVRLFVTLCIVALRVGVQG